MESNSKTPNKSNKDEISLDNETKITDKILSCADIPKNALYLGLEVQDPIDKIFEIITISLKGILEAFPKIPDAEKILTMIEESSFENESNYKNPWKYPKEHKKWHVTSLFRKGSKFSNSHEAFMCFSEGKKITIEMRGVIYIPSKIITSVIFTDTPIENEFPHMTTLLGGYAAKNSNDACRELFGKDSPLEKEYKKMAKGEVSEGESFVERVEVKIMGKKETGYFFKFGSGILVETEMKAFLA